LLVFLYIVLFISIACFVIFVSIVQYLAQNERQ